MESQAIEKREAAPVANLRTLLEKSKGEIAKALQRRISPDLMIRVTLTAVQQTPKLMDCTPLSVLGAVMEASQLGLSLDKLLGHGYLVPYGKVAQFQPGYRGLIFLAEQSGKVLDVYSELVYEADKFKVVKGAHPDLLHEPNYDVEDRGAIIGCYAIAFLANGHVDFEYMTKAELDRIRNRSKAKDSGPWVTDKEEMYRKCPIRRLAKRLPLSPEFQRAAVLDEYADAGVAPGMEFGSASEDRGKPDLGVQGLKSRIKAAQKQESESLPPSSAPSASQGIQSVAPPAAAEAEAAPQYGEPAYPNPFVGILHFREGAKRAVVVGEDGRGMSLAFGEVPAESLKSRHNKKVSVTWAEEDGRFSIVTVQLAE